jgi:hypothetical protein
MAGLGCAAARIGTYLKHRDFHRDDHANLVLCCCVILLAESHNVHTLRVHTYASQSHTSVGPAGACCTAPAPRGMGHTLEPRAGPTGGAGFALPAGSASLIMPVTATGRVGKRDTCLRVCIPLSDNAQACSPACHSTLAPLHVLKLEELSTTVCLPRSTVSCLWLPLS